MSKGKTRGYERERLRLSLSIPQLLQWLSQVFDTPPGQTRQHSSLVHWNTGRYLESGPPPDAPSLRLLLKYG